MGVFTFSSDFTSPVPASRLFKALILDAHNLYPKITPLGIKSIDTIEGDGGPGSIEQINFTIDTQLTGSIVPYGNTTPIVVTNYVWSEECYETWYCGGDVVSTGYSVQNGSGQAITVMSDNAPVMGDPSGSLPDIRGIDEDVVLNESVETQDITGASAGIVGHVHKKRRTARAEVAEHSNQYSGAVNASDVGQFMNFEGYPSGGGEGWFSSYGGSAQVGNTGSYNERNRDHVEVEELRAMVEQLKKERDGLFRECTELRGKVEDHEREFLSYTNEFDRVLDDRRGLRAEVAALEREVNRLRRRPDRRY